MLEKPGIQNIVQLVNKNFAKFTGKHLYWCHFLIRLQVSRPETSLKRDCSKVFFCEFCPIFQKTLFTEHLQHTTTYLQLWEFVQKGYKN